MSGSQQTPTLSHSSRAAGYMSTSHELVRAAGSAAKLCALHALVASSNYFNQLLHAAAGAAILWRGCSSVPGGGLAARSLFGPLTRVETLQFGTIPPGSCH